MNIFKNNIKTFYYLNQKRFLGNTVRGPLPSEINKNFEYALDFFTKRANTYQDFKQQCESLRIFIYFGLVSFFSISFLIDPLKSSYWNKFMPINLFKCLFNFFSNKEDNIFRHNGNSSYEKYIKLFN